ncbi:MAG: hypothetical protein O7D91_17540 [Planctomycetota bacterium]|nr:hypothetical protein [Planctomycetota bacterium]
MANLRAIGDIDGVGNGADLETTMSTGPKTEGTDTRPKVAITCTTTGSLRHETAASLMRTMQDKRFQITLSLLNDRPYESALNVAAMLVMQEDFDWWIHIDNDQHWRGNPLDSIEHGKDVLGYPCPIHRPGDGSAIMCWNAWHIMDPEDKSQVSAAQSRGKLQRVDIIGSGSFLIRLDALREAAIPAPFARAYDVNGVATCGGDIEFCRKVREAGLQIWADFGNVTGHLVTVDLLDVMTDMGTIQAEAHKGSPVAPDDGLIITPTGAKIPPRL